MALAQSTSGKRATSRKKTPSAKKATRERLLEVAERHFAGKGLYGTSLRDIGRELSMANASLLYHFPSKRRMYAAVLDRIAHDLMRTADGIDDRASRCGEVERVELLIDAMFDWAQRHPHHVRIIVRELVDNAERDEVVGRWYLSEVVDRLSRHISGRRAPERQVLWLHFVGSLSYFLIGLPTVAPMLDRKPEALLRTYRRELSRQMKLLTA